MKLLGPRLYYYAPRDGWLPFLATGWRLPWIVEPMEGNHGAFSILLWRDEESPCA